MARVRCSERRKQTEAIARVTLVGLVVAAFCIGGPQRFCEALFALLMIGVVLTIVTLSVYEVWDGYRTRQRRMKRETGELNSIRFGDSSADTVKR